MKPPDSDTMRRVKAGRFNLCLDKPFYASLLLNMTLTEDPTCKTLWTDGTTIGFNPEYVNACTDDELRTDLAHEALHPGLLHHVRRGGRDNALWNAACDYAIYDILRGEPGNYWHFRGDELYDPRFAGQSAEEIFKTLKNEKEKEKGDGDQGGKDGGDQQQGGDDKQKGNQAPQDAPGDAQGNSGTQPPAPDKNNQPGGNQRAETPSPDLGRGEVRDAPVPTGSDPARAAAEETAKWNVAMAQAAIHAKGQGSLPGGIEELLQDLLNPRVDWREMLRRFVDAAAKNDYAWLPPNRRFIHRGLYLPGLRSNEIGTLVCAIDTSASVSTEDLNAIASEITGILEEYDTTVWRVYCDRAVRGEPEELGSYDLPVEFTVAGRGGTDFRPVFEWVEEAGIAPACLLYFSDLESSRFPENAPPYPVMWVCTGDGRSARTPPFGEVVKI
jgi:predicted metal-dependent peptidase